MKISVKEILLSLFLLLFYCCLWIALEWAQNGIIVNRDVDNEIMILLYPMFLLSAKYILSKKK